MPVRLIDSLATTEPLARLFSGESVAGAMLEFEVALARAQAKMKIIPARAAKVIAGAAQNGFRAEEIARVAHDAFLSATPGLPLVQALTAKVQKKDAAAAGYLHWGATSQDVCDTAMVLLLQRARPFLDVDLFRLQRALRHLSETHRNTVMLSRTLLQAAPPTTFGLKAAGWLAAIDRSHRRLQVCFEESLILQFGGACGTLASLDRRGIAVGKALAQELGLKFPEAPWHSHRDRLAALVSACGVLCASLGKMARDVSLLMQSEIAEAAEPRGDERGGDQRGGSSAMPQKHNPAGCAVALAAAVRVPGLVASFFAAMVQEHERGLGGLQAEWPLIAGVVQTTAAAAAAIAGVAEGLTIDPARMRANIGATGGTIFAERAVMRLSGKLGRPAAQKIVRDAAQRSREQKKSLAQTLSETKAVAAYFDAAILRDLENPDDYLGAAEEFRSRLLASVSTRSRTVKKLRRRKE